MPNTIQIITNLIMIVCVLYLIFENQKINSSLQEQVDQGDSVTVKGEYIDVSAVKCPSSYDEQSGSFRNENYWIFQKRKGEENISLVLRPNRNTGNWDVDVGPAGKQISISPDYYEWESYIYSGINSLNRKNLALERKRVDRVTAISQCELIDPTDARNEVDSRYNRQLEGNRL